MRTRVDIHFRPFTSHSERKDAGYYTDLNKDRKAKIEVASGELTLEQIMTVYHEVTHYVFDLLCQYEFRPEDRKLVKRVDGVELKEEWKQEVATVQRKNKIREELVEEIICTKIERAVKRALKKDLPPNFKKKFFPDSK